MYQRILVPVDGSDTSNQALTVAIGLAQAFHGRLRLIHVVAEMGYSTGLEPYGGYSGGLVQAIREAGSRVLADGMALARAADVEADSVLFDEFGGRLGETVADAATEWKADLVVVGTHGRRGLGRLLLGSGAEQIIRLAPVHVLAIRGTSATGEG
ncbi:universal stress protein [Caenimonas sedimenti]|uniref:Universal stress protein n=1 Tax=Caenimonas sedimenti TaxID=2596921 RepID=A0A562ZWF8_9BURK|nr:universal stress protein [Caenimonas sedimenti]TWO72716.1 universal stress protein [Caenimonas sedimenti]